MLTMSSRFLFCLVEMVLLTPIKVLSKHINVMEPLSPNFVFLNRERHWIILYNCFIHKIEYAIHA